MRESRLYLHFFWKNLWLFLIFGLIGALFSYQIYLQQQPLYKLTRQVELNYTKDNLDQIATLADEMVANVRSSARQQAIEIDPNTHLSAYKSGPVLINLEIESNQPDKLAPNLQKEMIFLSSSYQFKIVGSDQAIIESAKLYQYLLAGLSLGFIFGLIIALVREYFDRF